MVTTYATQTWHISLYEGGNQSSKFDVSNSSYVNLMNHSPDINGQVAKLDR